ncbi:MAG: hypothetical protein JXB04_08905, partial [Kiritimatiellae bacterium]|nr:hypothetical protein [Kiritimatiellia bacterium]
SYHNTYCPEFRLEILGTNQGCLAREAESYDSVASGTVVACSGAYAGSALLMATGGAEAVYNITLPSAAPSASVRVRYAEADGGDAVDILGNTIRVIVDGTTTAETYAVDTGGTNDFELSPSLVLGDLAAGGHEIRIQTGPGTGGIILDSFDLVSQPMRPRAGKSIMTQQGETIWWGHPPGHLGWVSRPTAVSNMALHVEGTNGEPWTTVGYYISNNIAQDYDHVFLRLRYSDDVGPNMTYVLVDDVIRARFGTEDTSPDQAAVWDMYTNFYPIYLGPLTAGSVQIMFRITNATWGFDLDEFELYAINWPPEIGLDAWQTLPVGSSTSFPVTTYDENGDSVIITNTMAPSGATFVGGTFAWSAGPDDEKTTNLLSFVADDQQGLANSVVTNLAWIVVPYDWDGDELADGWEWTCFTSLIHGAAGDYDEDGSDNFTEQVAGTTPTDSNSCFRATAADPVNAGGRSITVGTEAGREYQILYADGSFADDLPWSPFANTNAGVWIETGTVAGTHTFIDDEGADTTGGAPAGGVRHYRVRVGKTEI